MKKIVNISHDKLHVFGAIDASGRTEIVKLQVGDAVILVTDEYTGPSNCRVKHGAVNTSLVHYDTNRDGIPGNMDSSQKRLDGWRGTTDDWSRHAHGVWRIVEIGESRQWEERPEPRYNFNGVRKARVVLEKIEIGKEG